ncbi:MAG: NADP-dependent oxidoreductase [Myxococcota bacterium]
MARMSREIRLAARPTGLPKESDFELAEVEVGAPKEGQLLVENVYMSVDPYMRGRMNDVRSYAPPFQIGEPLDGGAVGHVIESRHSGFEAGDFVMSLMAWREAFLSDGGGLRKVDGKVAPLSAYLGALGGPGLTAYGALLDIGAPKEGETVFVSGAAGAVGSLAGQIARIKGCRVVGSAGTDEKVRFLRDELGFDAAFNYRSGPLREALAEHAPDGVDIYFDNVGGDHLEAALHAMRPHGRIIACGMISQYNETEPPPGPNNLILIVTKSLTMRGFLTGQYFDRLADFLRDMSGWLSEGRVHVRETIAEGIESAPRAFIGLLEGANTGKMLVRLSPEPDPR